MKDSIEDKIFLNAAPDFDKLQTYGFTRKNNCFEYEKTFLNDEFKAVITIDKNNKLTGTVFDTQSGEEYFPLRMLNSQGAFVGTVKSAYEDLLTDILEKCFTKTYFLFSQANRIANLIFKEFGDKPDFPWGEFDHYGVFRNPQNEKWYALVMNIDKSKLQKTLSGEIEIVNIKLDEDKIQELLKQKGFYPAYHMNKKKWISILLDETLDDNTIMDLIQESHHFTIKKKS